MKRSRVITTIILLFLFPLILNTTIAQDNQDDTISVNFAEIGINNFFVTATGSPATVFLPIQTNWDLSQTTVDLTLEYIASSQIPDGANLTISAGSIPITTVPIVNDNTLQQVDVRIPGSLIQDFGIQVQMSIFSPSTENPCDALRDTGQWFRVESSSSIDYSPVRRTDEFTIPDAGTRLLPVKISDLNSEIEVNTVEPVTYLVLPDDPTPSEMTAAAQIMARIGRTMRSFSFNNASVVYASDLTTEIRTGSHLIYIGTAERLPLFAEDGTPVDALEAEATAEPDTAPSETDGMLSEQDLTTVIANAISSGSPLPLDLLQETIGEGAAFVASFTDTNDPTLNRFVVVGTDAEGLALAGQSFQNSSSYGLMLDSEITLDENLPERNVEPNVPWSGEVTTFSTLGIPDIRLEGTGIVRNEVRLNIPAGIELTADSTLIINWIASPALDPDTTYVGLSLNGIPVATLRPDPERDGLPQSVEIPIPSQALNQSPLGTRQQVYQLSFEAFNSFRTGDDDCPDQAGAWLNVFDNSAFNVGYNSATVPDLHVFPYPFVSREQEEQTAIILPDDYDTQDVESAMTMATALGRYATLDHDVMITNKSTALDDDSILEDNHLIVIGIEQNDEFSLEIFENLVDAQAQRNNAAYPASMYAIQSPYNPDKQVLLATGDTPTAVNDIVLAFVETVPAVDQPTTSVVINDDNEVINLNRIEFNVETDQNNGSNTTQGVTDESAVVVVTATPQAEATSLQDALATALATPGNNSPDESGNTTGTNTTEDSENTPVSSQLSFIIIIILAALVLPFAFALTRNNS